ncbi:hypothetical protein [Methylocystis rosea]|nr:hypothetical protein [Methylocystis rosea]
MTRKDRRTIERDAERGEKISDRDIRQICRKFLNRKKVRASGEKIEPK